MVTRFEVDSETSVRIGEVGSNYGRPGGGIQYEIRYPDMRENSARDITMDDLPLAPGEQYRLNEFLSD